MEPQCAGCGRMLDHAGNIWENCWLRDLEKIGGIISPLVFVQLEKNKPSTVPPYCGNHLQSHPSDLKVPT